MKVITLCQDCLRIKTVNSWEEVHEMRCKCGGDLCSCGSCRDFIKDLREGVSNALLGFNGEILQWDEENGIAFMTQTEYENQADPQPVQPGSVVVENYSMEYHSNKNIFHVKTTGEWFTYACFTSGGTLYCLDNNGEIDVLRPSVFRAPAK